MSDAAQIGPEIIYSTFENVIRDKDYLYNHLYCRGRPVPEHKYYLYPVTITCESQPSKGVILDVYGMSYDAKPIRLIVTVGTPIK